MMPLPPDRTGVTAVTRLLPHISGTCDFRLMCIQINVIDIMQNAFICRQILGLNVVFKSNFDNFSSKLIFKLVYLLRIIEKYNVLHFIHTRIYIIQ